MPDNDVAHVQVNMSLNSMRPVSRLVPGYMLDRYELLRPIAEGGMASVWIARLHGKRGFEKLVAVKTILPKYAADAAFQEMLLDEARVASRIHHLNVAQILDLGEEQDILYLVAEWIDGDSLFKLYDLVCKKGISFPPGILLRILADTCAGLHAAHELRDDNDNPLGVVHRDVSPQNILVSAQGIAKLIDFGIAKMQNRFARDTNSGVIKGKVQYMSPEHARGLRIDRRADIWAVGTILYWLLSGNVPYDGGSPVRTLGLVAAGRRPAPLPAGVHPAIRAVVDKALSPRLDARFATAADLRDAIERAMIAANATAATTDVALFIGKHIGDRAAARKYAIALAIKAAANWRLLQRVLERPSPSSSSLRAARPHAQRADTTAQAVAAEPSPASCQAPYDGGRVTKTLGLVATSRPAPPSEKMHPAIRAAINDALRPHLDGRFCAAADVCEAIERAMIAANLAPTTTNVKAFIGQLAGERSSAARDVIDLAVKAAAQLPSSQRALQLPSPSSYRLVTPRLETQRRPPTYQAIATESGAATLPNVPAVIDRRADILAFGTILIRLLSGDAPYDGGSVMTSGRVASGEGAAPLSERTRAAVRAAINDAVGSQSNGRFSAAADLCEALERAMNAGSAPPTTTDVAAFIGQARREHAAVRKDALDLAINAAAQLRSAQRALQLPSSSSSSLIATRPDWAAPTLPQAPAADSGANTLPYLPTDPGPPRSPIAGVARRIAFPRTRRGWVVLGLAISIGGVAVLRAVGPGHAADFKSTMASPMLSGEAIAASLAPQTPQTSSDPHDTALESIGSTGTARSRAAAHPEAPVPRPKTPSGETARGP